MTTASSSNDSLDRLLLNLEGNDDGLYLADFDADGDMAPTSVTDMGMEMETMDFVMEGMIHKEETTATPFHTGSVGFVGDSAADLDHHQGHHGDHDHLNLSHSNLEGALFSMFQQQQQPPPPSHFEQQQVARKVSLASETSNTFHAAFHAPPLLFSQPPQQQTMQQQTQQQAEVRAASRPKKRCKHHRRSQTDGCFDFLYQQQEQQSSPHRIVNDLIGGAAGGGDNHHLLAKTNPDRLKMMANSFVEQERRQIVAAAAPAGLASAGIRRTVPVQAPVTRVSPPAPAVARVSLPEVAMAPAPPVPEIVVLDSNDDEEEKDGCMSPTTGGQEPSRLSKFLDTLQAKVDQDNAMLRQQMGITEEEAWMSMVQEQNHMGCMEQLGQQQQPQQPSRQGKRRNHHRRVVSEGGAYAHHFAAAAATSSNRHYNNSNGRMPFGGVLDFDMADRKEDAALFSSAFMS